jgi:uncharacterized protein (DUF433 family)
MSKSTEDRITRSPEVCGGNACIAGHRIRVLDVVVWHEHQGMTPDEIVSHFPTITLADVHAALAYYFDHVEEIQQEMRAEREFSEEVRRRNPSLLEAKLRQERLRGSILTGRPMLSWWQELLWRIRFLPTSKSGTAVST